MRETIGSKVASVALDLGLSSLQGPQLGTGS